MEHRHCRPLASVPDVSSRQPAPPTLVYTVAEAAARLRVSAGTVRNMIDQGQLYAIRLHVRRIVIPRWALEELVARPTTTVTELHRPASNE